MIDAEGYAYLYGYLYLHEAIKISAYFEGEARPGKEPRVYIRTRPVKATCRIAAAREIIGSLTWELMGKRDDTHSPFRSGAAPALDDG